MKHCLIFEIYISSRLNLKLQGKHRNKLVKKIYQNIWKRRSSKRRAVFDTQNRISINLISVTVKISLVFNRQITNKFEYMSEYVKDIFELRRKIAVCYLTIFRAKCSIKILAPFQFKMFETIIRKTKKSTIYGHFTDPVGNGLAFLSRHATPLKRGASFRDVLLNAP